MRHFLANIAIYTIAVLLILGATVFAWVRSQQVVLTSERTVLARFEPTPEHEFLWPQLGPASYERNCMNCHLESGRGWDQYPGVGHTAALFGGPGGREYLIDIHLYGLTSDRWRVPMPPMRHMADVELAAVLNYLLTSFGNERVLPPDAPLYLPTDIMARRGLRLSSAEVNEYRPPVD